MKGLIIDEPWIGLITSGKKTGEMCSRNTQVRGLIALIKKGSKTVVGVVDLVGTIPNLSRSDRRGTVAKHPVPENEIGEDFKHSTAWVLERARPLRAPVAYRHPAGAVIWVNLDPEVEAVAQRQMPHR